MTNLLSSYSGVCGFYKVIVQKGDGSEIETGWFPNLITDVGLNLLAGDGFLSRCSVGTSNTPPTFTDTQLGNKLAYVNGSVSAGPSDANEGWVSLVGTYRFAQGAVVGNIQELGVGPTDDRLLSRALVLDSAGSPTSLTVTSSDILVVVYQLRIYRNTTDTVSTVTDGDVTYNVTSRAAFGADSARAYSWHNRGAVSSSSYVFFYGGAIGPWTGSPSGASSIVGTLTVAPYSTGTHYLDATVVATPTQGNLSGGIRSIVLGDGYVPDAGGIAIQAEINPVIVKTDQQTLSIGFRVSWGRHTP